jgi:hypothetical protein
MAHLFYAGGEDMKASQLVVLVGASHAGRQRRNLPAAFRDPAQARQTARARTLDDTIARNLKEFGHGG